MGVFLRKTQKLKQQPQPNTNLTHCSPKPFTWCKKNYLISSKERLQIATHYSVMNMTIGEEVAPKFRRLLYFVGAGFVCTAAINKWREWEKKAKLQQQQQTDNKSLQNSVSNSSTDMVQKARD